MLTGYQCEVIAALTDDGILCLDCALEDYSDVAREKWERGLSCSIPEDVRPLIRYAVDEDSGELTWEYAGARVDDFVHEHPQLVALFAINGDRERELIDRWADHHPWTTRCDHCGSEID